MMVLKITLAIMKLHLRKKCLEKRKPGKHKSLVEMKKGTGGRLLIREIYRRVQHTIFSGPLARYKRCLLLLTSIQWKSCLPRSGAGEIRAESKGHRPQDIRYGDSTLRNRKRGHTTMVRTQRLFRIEPLTVLS